MSSVSFVIPVYNKSRFLNFVVNSLISQKGSFEREFIFIDDGSTDNSYTKLKNLTRNLKNCKILKQKNNGSAHATNVGIKLAKMKYIKFLDADDILLKDATASLIRILENDNSLVLAYGLQRKVSNLKSVDLSERFTIAKVGFV